MKSAKNAFYKKGAPKLTFFNEFFFRKIRMIYEIENSLWKSKIGTNNYENGRENIFVLMVVLELKVENWALF